MEEVNNKATEAKVISKVTRQATEADKLTEAMEAKQVDKAETKHMVEAKLPVEVNRVVTEANKVVMVANKVVRMEVVKDTKNPNLNHTNLLIKLMMVTATIISTWKMLTITELKKDLTVIQMLMVCTEK